MAFCGSDAARFFIWERMSRSCGAGIACRVLEMASGACMPGGRSTPGGNCGNAAAPPSMLGAPFGG